jgi:UDP-N-acetylmuramoyl-tripeptide--D-alanyl-D-alanine ligase
LDREGDQGHVGRPLDGWTVKTFEGISAVLALTALAVRLAGRHHRLLHLLQLEHYEPARLLLWLRRRSELSEPRELISLGALYGAATADAAAGGGWFAGALLLLSVPIAVRGVRDWRREAVKPLVFTGRARRLFALALAPSVLLTLVAVGLAILGLDTVALAVLLALGLLSLVLAPWTLLTANRALAPVQSAINRRYVDRARRSLDEVRPLVVGITGSYGKTTTKFCVGEVLSVDRPTLVTPESYNSFLGVTRAINERLEPRHRAFVVEMGMFRGGDIAELCELVHPTIGVITAIGPMHLERLGSVEAIAAAKAELLDALPADGHFVTNADDPRCVELAARSHVPVTLFGIEDSPAQTIGSPARVVEDPSAQTIGSPARVVEDPSAQTMGSPPQVLAGPSAQVIAREVRISDGRTRFRLHLDGPHSPPIEVSAALLGGHNVSNLLAAAAVGRVLEIEPARIAEGIARVRAPAHRLQPIHNRRAGIVVIDDAYNSNPDGAQAALEVLAEHPATRRLLVTPGMVELGELESECNRRFGEQAAAVCDLAILVGPSRTEPIREGLAAAGMGPASIHVVRDIGEATVLLGRLTRAGDVVLFENDLPDTYEEAASPRQ